ncbi:MAG: FAD-dependent monooxygenase [Betaproteobacteria bacterium]|nr:FAD-dependent monooxygenase [Betaproteobacteria bacterium]
MKKIMTHRHAEIAGAGFAGLVAAIALADRGWSVRVHEKDAVLRAFGAGIFIWENGLRVLQAIGAYEAVMQAAHEAIIHETRENNRIIARLAFTPAFGSRMITMTRQHLYDAILGRARQCGVTVVTDSAAIGATEDGTLLTADGRSHRADLVIGADGVKSKVRDALGLLTSRSPCADGIVRVLAPRCKDELGPGTWDHVIDFWRADRSLRILYCPCNEQELYLAMMAPVSNLEASAIPLRHDVWVAAFPQLEPVIRKIDAGGRYDAYETTNLERWSAGRVAIVGDAAHAMVPTLGQGAGTAMMNALSLAVHLDEAPSIEAALTAWEARERPLTEHTQQRSDFTARQRLMATGEGWTDEALRAARHIPTGTTQPRID